MCFGFDAALPQVSERFLQGGDFAEPGPVAGLDQPVLGAAGHRLEAGQLSGVDALAAIGVEGLVAKG